MATFTSMWLVCPRWCEDTCLESRISGRGNLGGVFPHANMLVDETGMPSVSPYLCFNTLGKAYAPILRCIMNPECQCGWDISNIHVRESWASNERALALVGSSRQVTIVTSEYGVSTETVPSSRDGGKTGASLGPSPSWMAFTDTCCHKTTTPGSSKSSRLVVTGISRDMYVTCEENFWREESL